MRKVSLSLMEHQIKTKKMKRTTTQALCVYLSAQTVAESVVAGGKGPSFTTHKGKNKT